MVDEDGTADICQMVCRTTPLKKLYGNPGLQDVEFDVVPELSAQIYGFLESDRFDKKVKNVFMIVDVGAGAVDSSVFHVKRGRAH